MYTLGISCFYHDSAAVLIHNGNVIAASQEERHSRIKHDWRFPSKSIEFCLRTAGIDSKGIDVCAYYEKPFLKFERMIETFLSIAPRGYIAFIDSMPSWLRQKLWVPHLINKNTGYDGRLLYAEHHLSHAASAFFASPFEDAAVLTIDGVGEWATASYGLASGSKINVTHEMRFPHSLGLLYSTLTTFLGFKANNDEYKVMGMAPYGTPEYYDLFLKELVTVRDDGSLMLNLDYFSFQYGRRMFNGRRFARLFGINPRKADSEITQEHYDIAASLQKVTETAVMNMARHVYAETKLKRLCIAGGVALNSVANGRLLREGPFEEIFFQPAAGDAGAAMGAAWLAYHSVAEKPERHPLKSVYLGPEYDSAQIRTAIGNAGLNGQELQGDDLVFRAARLLAEGKVVGWFQGRMEFGPRALGNRSILADPRRPEMKDILNLKVKFREAFRPFAPAVTDSARSEFFNLDRQSPYMLMTVPVISDRIPAATHADGSARVQTVSPETNPLYHALIEEFGRLTGVPVLINTSLNIRGEPIAMTPEDAIRCFTGSDMDCLVLGNCLVLK
ncbi:MAG: carbamoyltransferase [Nitrospirae bacterium]|nr:carbamoyltransferase [Nitrospirota bacterium]